MKFVVSSRSQPSLFTPLIRITSFGDPSAKQTSTLFPLPRYQRKDPPLLPGPNEVTTPYFGLADGKPLK